MIADITLTWNLIANVFVGCLLALLVYAIVMRIIR